MTDNDQGKSDDLDVKHLYQNFGEGLRRFLVGVLGDSVLADDVLHNVFTKTIERGHTAEPTKLKAWLYRVAYNEAMLVRRREATGDRVMRQVLWTRQTESPSSDQPLVRRETIERVREAIKQLPSEQQQIVRMRIYEEKTFAVIAEELKIPLGTALGRMRSAMAKLRTALDN